MIYLALQVIIYSGDGLTPQQLLNSAASNFDITVTDSFKVKLLMLELHTTALAFLAQSHTAISALYAKSCMCSVCAAVHVQPNGHPQAMVPTCQNAIFIGARHSDVGT